MHHVSFAPLGLVAAAILTSSTFAQTDTPPVCNPGGPYTIECSGPETLAQVDASLSYDPDGTPLTFLWFDDCPFTTILDPTNAIATVVIHMEGVCSRVCEVRVRVTSGGQNRICGALLTVSDTQAPVISCPSDVTEIWTSGYSGPQVNPANTGYATASDCDSNVLVSYSDVVTHGTQIGEPEDIITRTWTAIDICGFSSSCQQVITLLSPGLTYQSYYLDSIRGSCPNVIDVNQTSGLFTAAIFARAGFPVADINQSTLVLARADNVGGTVLRMAKVIKDTGRPNQGNPCDCDGLNDSLPDLNLSMAMPAVIANLDLDLEPTGASLVLVLYFKTNDGKWHTTRDCITIDRQ